MWRCSFFTSLYFFTLLYIETKFACLILKEVNQVMKDVDEHDPVPLWRTKSTESSPGSENIVPLLYSIQVNLKVSESIFHFNIYMKNVLLMQGWKMAGRAEKFSRKSVVISQKFVNFCDLRDRS